jgi:hypothetical protein
MRNLALLLSLLAGMGTYGAAPDPIDNLVISDLQKAYPHIQQIYYRSIRPIDRQISVFAAYALRDRDVCNKLDEHKIGIYVMDTKLNKILIKLDVIASERGCDFLPTILSATKSEAVVSFISDYGELAKRKYSFDLTKKRFKSKSDLPVKGVPEDMD